MTKTADIYYPTGEVEKTFINSIWRLSEYDLHKRKEIILPKGTVEIIFNYSDKINYFNPSLQVSKKLPTVFVNGINFKPFELIKTGRQEFLGIQLNSIGLRLLFNISAKEFNNSVYEGKQICSHLDILADELFCKQTLHELRMSGLYNYSKFINSNFAANFNETDMLKHRNLVGWVTLLSGVIGLVSYFLVAGAVNFNFEFFSNPSLIFTIDGVNSTMLKWSMITDMFGYYLLLLPVLFFIHEWLKDKTEWRNIFTFCGASYIFAGALGASILGATWPIWLDKFSSATPEQQEIIKITFENLTLIVGNGIWNLFDALMFGVWFIAIGIYIKRYHAIWGWFTIIVGLLSTLDFTGNALGIKAMADVAVNLYLILAPLWAIGFGWALKQNKVLQHSN